MRPLIDVIIAEHEGKKTLAWDVDCTLADTRGYFFRTINREVGNRRNLTTAQLMALYHYTEDVDFWNDQARAQRLMAEMRFQDDHQLALEPYENTPQLVQSIDAIIKTAAYITARPSYQADVTSRWLKQHQFPPALVLARNNGTDHAGGNRWKAHILMDLYPTVVGIVDDHPQLATILHEMGYQGTVFVIGQDSHPHANGRILPCPTLLDVQHEALQRYS